VEEFEIPEHCGRRENWMQFPPRYKHGIPAFTVGLLVGAQEWHNGLRVTAALMRCHDFRKISRGITESRDSFREILLGNGERLQPENH
jgi:hypothetical protein